MFSQWGGCNLADSWSEECSLGKVYWRLGGGISYVANVKGCFSLGGSFEPVATGPHYSWYLQAYCRDGCGGYIHSVPHRRNRRESIHSML